MIVIKNGKVRAAFRICLPFVLMPALVALGVFVFDEKRYAFIALALALGSVALCAAVVERRQAGSRRLGLVSIMRARATAGRFIPLLKPVTALAVLTGMYLGGEAGFLCGSLSAVLSNFFFGQGPWTPFQMLALGLIGLFAGYLARPLIRSKLFLLFFGVAAGVLYSFIMDVWTVLWYNGSFDVGLYLTALGTALPFTLSYAAANVIFLLLFARPFGEKLGRVRLKYGI